MFEDAIRAEASLARIGRLCRRDLSDVLRSMFGDWPRGEDGLSRLERIVAVLSSPGVLADQLVEFPELAGLLASVLCSSHHLGDVLIQNPELVFQFFDPQMLDCKVSQDLVLAEGGRLLGHSSSYSHQLDRLRFLKQKYLLILAAQDIGGLKPQPQVWQGISELALALVALTRSSVWEQLAKRENTEIECPVQIAVFGKIGGLELNYSSDIDLIFVTPDDLSETEEGIAKKFCEDFRSAVSGRMGRGDLYRIDLRLRPFGKQGALLSRMKAVEAYYDKYAEPWEHMALIRSFVITPGEVADRWEAMRNTIAFRESRSEMAVDNILKMRRRAEEEADPSDIKRGRGGIRDIEFSVQIAQLLRGSETHELRGRGTLEMLDACERVGALNERQAATYRDSYPFLRKLEHRCQIEGNRQTHALPDSVELREVIAYSLGYGTVGALEDELAFRRDQVRGVYNELFGSIVSSGAQQSHDWLSSLPGGDAFAKVVVENESSASRLAQISVQAPVLLPYLKQSVSVVEQVLSGEVQEEVDPDEKFALLRTHYDRQEMHRAIRNGWLRANLRWIFVAGVDLGPLLSDHMDSAISALAYRWGEGVSVFGLGSYAGREMSPGSDADILVMVSDDSDRASVERSVQSAAIEISKLRGLGAPFEVDFRLRPEGKNGRMVTTPASLVKYAADRMEPWEKFALGRVRTVFGDQDQIQLLHEIVYGTPITDIELESLLNMKSRMERERVKPTQRDRHLKLGLGGLDDINWLLQLWLLRRPEMGGANQVPISTSLRLRKLFENGVLDAVEHDALLEGHRFLTLARNWLYLLGIGDDILPENPDKLLLLGNRFGLSDPNDMIALYHGHTRRVRGIFEQSLEELVS